MSTAVENLDQKALAAMQKAPAPSSRRREVVLYPRKCSF